VIVSVEMPPLPDRLRLVVWHSAPGLAAAVGSLRAWPAQWVLLGIVAGGVLAAAVQATRAKPAGKPAKKSWTRAALGVVLFGASAVFAFGSLTGARLIVLDLVGRPTAAHIGDVDEEKTPTRRIYDKTDYCYDLLRPDGSSFTGRICRDAREYSEGEIVEVLAEPTGLIAPETTAEVTGSIWLRAITLGAFALMCLAGLFGGGLAPAERPLVPSGRYPAWRTLPPQPERRHRPRRQPRKGRRR
jgi:hypothetical protein